jgi:hypothetical protein
MARAKIPGGVTPEHFLEINHLLIRFLMNVKDVAKGAAPMWASCRLNESRDDISPVFVGWVEDTALERRRIAKNQPHPGLFRFGDDHYSEIFEDCVKHPGVVRKRDWHQDLADPVRGQWMDNAKKISVGMGVMYRRSIGIKVERWCAGTINIGFDKNPARVDSSVARVMKNWANPNSPLVRYLRDNFDLGGPKI